MLQSRYESGPSRVPKPGRLGIRPDAVSRGGQPGESMQALKGPFMEKWLCFGSMGVAGVLMLLFLLDLLFAFPFNRISGTVDVFGILAGGLILYLAYDAFRDLR